MIDIVNSYLNLLTENKLTAFNHPGIAADTLADFAAKQHIRLPPLLKRLYQKIGGQDAEILTRFPYRLLPPEEIAAAQAHLLQHIQQTYGEHWSSYRINPFEDEGKVQNILYHPARLPVLQNDNGDYYCLDYAPEAQGTAGQVLAVIGKPTLQDEPFFLMFEDFEECLQDIIADLQGENPQDLEDFFSELQEMPYGYEFENADNREERLYEQKDSADFNQYDTQIRQHIRRSVGKLTNVFYDDTDKDNPLVFYHIAPEASHPFHTFITGGMSHLPMVLPEEIPTDEQKAFRRAELVIFLPAQWRISQPVFDHNAATDWPLRILQILTRLPQQQKTYFDIGQIIRVNAEENIADTDFRGLLLIPPLHLAPDFAALHTDDGEIIRFLAVMPLYAEEISLHLSQGPEALTEKFGEYGINAIIDPERINCAED